jgi:hypothetical protein
MKQVSVSTTIPSPVGGLNAYDAIPSMPQNDAIVLRNWFPNAYGLTVRKGYKEHATGFTGVVKTLMTWRNIDGSNKLFAVDDEGIYDVSSAGAVSGTPAVSTTNSKWEYTNFGNAAGTHLIAFNGTDDGVWYTGTTWTRLVVGTSPGTGVWQGVDPKTLVQPMVYQQRLWAVQENSTLAWYLPAEQIYGEATSFNFGAVFSRGGYLQALTTWTHDGGSGIDDYMLAISSAGQVAVFKGLSPDSAETWSLVGVFFIGGTFTRRCYAKYGGDVLFLTQYGVLSMEGIMRSSDGSVLTTALSRKIQTLISELTTEGSAREGWQILVYPSANLLIINIPGVQLDQNLQLAANTILGSWTIFDNMRAYTWGTDYDSLFFAGDGVVYRAWEGTQDNVGLVSNTGDPITCVVQQAFSYFNMPGKLKHFKLIRPTFLTSSSFSYQIGVNLDFQFDSIESPGEIGVVTSGIWHLTNWDETTWAGGIKTDKQWSSVIGVGYAGAVRMTLGSSGELTWTNCDWILEQGGII